VDREARLRVRFRRLLAEHASVIVENRVRSLDDRTVDRLTSALEQESLSMDDAAARAIEYGP